MSGGYTTTSNNSTDTVDKTNGNDETERDGPLNRYEFNYAMFKRSENAVSQKIMHL